MQHVHDRDARVQPDQVGERQRSHRMGEAELRDRVDRLGFRDALEHGVRGLVDERHQDPVRNEAGKVVGVRRHLAEVLSQLRDRRGRLVGRLQRADHLHELQHRHRIEEVHPDHAVGPVCDSRQGRDRDRRRVRGQDRPVGKDPVRAAEEVLLHRRVLHDGLDHQVGSHELVDSRHPSEDLVRVGTALLGEPLEALAHRRQAAFRRTGQRVVERDATAGDGHDLRDATAHLTCADDKDVLEVHTSMSLSGTLGRGSGVHPT